MPSEKVHKCSKCGTHKAKPAKEREAAVKEDKPTVHAGKHTVEVLERLEEGQSDGLLFDVYPMTSEQMDILRRENGQLRRQRDAAAVCGGGGAALAPAVSP